MTVQPFKFRNAAHVHRAIQRWCSLSKRQRCDAICKQHGFSDASRIFDRDSRGKCRDQATFIGECEGVMVTFDYWGVAMIGYWQLDADCDVSIVAEAIADPQCTQPEHSNEIEDEPDCEIEDEPDYGPSNPWNAPGMKPSDFVRGCR